MFTAGSAELVAATAAKFETVITSLLQGSAGDGSQTDELGSKLLDSWVPDLGCIPKHLN